MNLSELISNRNEENFQFFNKWVLDFFRREALRDSGRLEEYSINSQFGSAMREEVSYWQKYFFW